MKRESENNFNMKAPFTEVNVSNKVSSKTEDRKGKSYHDELMMIRECPSDEDFGKVESLMKHENGINMGDLENAIETLQGVLAKLGKRTGATKSKALLAARKKVAENAEKVLELHRHYNDLAANLTKTQERINVLEGKDAACVDHDALETGHPTMETSITLASSDPDSLMQNTSASRDTMVFPKTSIYSYEYQCEETTEGIETIAVSKNQNLGVDSKETVKSTSQVPIIAFNSLECEIKRNEDEFESKESSDWTSENDDEELGNSSHVDSSDWSMLLEDNSEHFPFNNTLIGTPVVVPLEIQVSQNEGKDKAVKDDCGPNTNIMFSVDAVGTTRQKSTQNHDACGIHTGDVIDGYYPDIVMQKRAPNTRGCFSSGIECLCCFGGTSEGQNYHMTFEHHSPILTTIERDLVDMTIE